MLNACRRQRSVHQGAGPQREPRCRVLNACRRQRSVHHLVVLWSEINRLCSTPVGVKDRFTSHTDLTTSACLCAQRLSASKIGSHRDRGAAAADQLVLNACRRQRSVHEVGRPRRSAVPYVLNACRRQRSVHQRGGNCQGIGECVLNACRRQRSVHAPGPRRPQPRIRVLNACRRQRSVHRKTGSYQSSGVSCSTPVGVKDRFTRVPGSPFLSAFGVLNACRRQRSVHYNLAADMGGIGLCSTPVGVKDRFTT